MPKPTQPVSKIAVEMLYNSIDNLNHPDAGQIRLVYFGHKSEGQKTITRQVSEAIVLQLESNGMHIVNGLSEAEALLKANGYLVYSPTEQAAVYAPPTLHEDRSEAAGEPGEAPSDIPVFSSPLRGVTSV